MTSQIWNALSGWRQDFSFGGEGCSAGRLGDGSPPLGSFASVCDLGDKVPKELKQFTNIVYRR